MGVIISRIGEIETLRWTELRKGQVTRVKRAIRINETDVILELENGNLTVVGHRHTPNGNWAVQGYGLTKFNKTVLQGLVRMGILTKDQVHAHLLEVEARDKACERRGALKSLTSACEKLGIPVPEVPNDQV